MEKGRRFASAASTLVPAGGTADLLAGAFDWASLGPATIVDVGGGTGGVQYPARRDFPEPQVYGARSS